MENNVQNVKNNKQKKWVTGFLTFIIVILLLIIGIGAGWYFGKSGDIFDKNSKQEVNNTTNTEVRDNNTKTEIVEKTREMTSDEKFAIYADNMLMNYMNKLANSTISGSSNFNDRELFGIMEIVNDNKSAKILFNGESTYTTIATDVINCGVTSISQDNTVFIWAINTKGEVLGCKYNKDANTKEDVKLKKVEGLKNIISVNQNTILSGNSGYGKIVCFDIEGNMYEIK